MKVANAKASISVLVVDDQDSVVDLLVDIMQDMGFVTERAYDGAEALKKFDSGQFDLVITDIKMPNMDGVELMRRIKERSARVAVVAITGYGTSDTESQLLAEGMDGYLEKPFRLAKIEEVVRRVLRKSGVLG